MFQPFPLTFMAPSGGSYHADAVHFDGGAWLDIASLTATDNGTFSVSMWILWPTIQAGFDILWVADPNDDYGSFSYPLESGSLHPASLEIKLSSAGVNDSYTIITLDPIPINQWTHILYSVDSNQVMGSKVAAVYVNDVLVAFITSDNSGPIITPFNGLEFTVGGDTFDGDGFHGDGADWWIAPGVSLLSGSAIPEETRRLFISSDGKPVNPNSFPSGAILFSGDASTFPVNQGTGGSFTLTGSLTNASTSPSD